jgi:hypothetical protein
MVLFGSDRVSEPSHVLIAGVVPNPLREVAERYALRRASESGGADDVEPGPAVFRADPLADSMLDMLGSTVRTQSGFDVEPARAELSVHDCEPVIADGGTRPGSELRLLVNVGAGDRPVTARLAVEGRIESIDLTPGDGLLYRPARGAIRVECPDGVATVLLELTYSERRTGPDDRQPEKRSGFEVAPDEPDAARVLRPRRREGYLQENLGDDGIVIYYPDDDFAFGLSPSASLVWNQCDGSRTDREIVSLLETAYPEAVDRVLADVHSVLGELDRLGALEST